MEMQLACHLHVKVVGRAGLKAENLVVIMVEAMVVVKMAHLKGVW